MKTLILLLFCIFYCNVFYANNVKVENVGIANQNNTLDVKDIQFDISWDNSWRTSASPTNWDACWVFAKYRKTSSTTWEHATLSTSNGNHTAPSGSTIDAVSDGLGVFIFRDSDGTGNVDWDGAALEWSYGVDGLLDNDSVEVCVFAIEMVYVPQGSFYIGDGNGTTRSTLGFHEYPLVYNPVQITNSPSVRIRAVSGGDAPLATTGLYLDGDGGIDLNGNGIYTDAGDNPGYPVGYEAFYCMKYEITQGEYVEFANKLSTAQGTAILSASTTYRMNLIGSGNNWSTTTPNRPITISGYQLGAYLDWIALRPMTETEFEKACRGQATPVYQEYAWGTTNIQVAPYTLTADGTGSENVSNPGINIGNCNYNTTNSAALNGPFRSGIFASSSINHTREETGGSYYGIMELSGNLAEQCVDLGDPQGRSFDGSNGDGEIHSTGFADKSGWPNYNTGAGNNTTNDNGYAMRGGHWNIAVADARVSDRSQYNTASIGIVNTYYYNGRGVRKP